MNHSVIPSFIERGFVYVRYNFDRTPGPLNLASSHIIDPKFIMLLSAIGFIILMTLSTDLFCCQRIASPYFRTVCWHLDQQLLGSNSDYNITTSGPWASYLTSVKGLIG